MPLPDIMSSQGGAGLVLSSATGDIMLVPHVVRGLMEAVREGKMNITLVHPVSKRLKKTSVTSTGQHQI